MAIPYTKTAWVNRQAPPLSAANMNKIEGVISTIATGGSGSGLDADTLDGQQPASTNTADTVVKRDGSGDFAAGTITASLTGAASLNLLKTGGTITGAVSYTDATASTSPSTGAVIVTGGVGVGGRVNTAGAIESAATIKGTQLQSSIATGTAPFTVLSTTRVANLNAATAGDADTVSGYGIGIDNPTYLTVALNSIIKTGIYRCQYAPARNFPATNDVLLFCMAATDSVGYQIAMDLSTYFWYKRRTTSGDGTWYQIWDAHSDGNAGLPPAPKPKAYSSNAVGEWITRTVAHPSNFDLPAGTTWAYIAIRTNNSVLKDYVAGVEAGGTVVVNNNVGDTTVAMCWRIL